MITIIITKEDLTDKYLKDRTEVIHKEIHHVSSIGIMNGLWANALGMGGIIPIECNFWPSNTFMDFKEKVESHFEIIIVSEKFHNKSKIDRHRMVNECLKEEFLSDLHSVVIKTYTIDEHKYI